MGDVKTSGFRKGNVLIVKVHKSYFTELCSLGDGCQVFKRESNFIRQRRLHLINIVWHKSLCSFILYSEKISFMTSPVFISRWKLCQFKIIGICVSGSEKKDKYCCLQGDLHDHRVWFWPSQNLIEIHQQVKNQFKTVGICVGWIEIQSFFEIDRGTKDRYCSCLITFVSEVTRKFKCEVLCSSIIRYFHMSLHLCLQLNGCPYIPDRSNRARRISWFFSS